MQSFLFKGLSGGFSDTGINLVFQSKKVGDLGSVKIKTFQEWSGSFKA
jgi:hypothetical protein